MQPPKIELTEEQKKQMEENRAEIEHRIHRSAAAQRTFKGVDGEFTLKEIDILCSYKGSNFHPDPYKHAYNAGQRSVAVIIHDMIDQDIEKARELLGKENENA